ncbi:acetyl-CoA carboxylase biotin carboxyl carrier protein [Ligilactobacillus aviarius]|uniref:acetyl-CoA carboxylase biotin carboxyl carrier protein n=1 Tax=Ligilactobacillus aviarius TaxID=1606 RepID=UPI00195A9CA5|nr:acetyl-CoA carboxylase biotin carboxyl carrier protein [Ligilactobacillus aviarius]MBM6862465.1 acetyl-CoA carboxylase biotin carboxyl carrier protein [Ligilactobacillus aviarius]MDM8277647.1 acetyl-CoA carboxylase biotin carboxyl carrier protein [Ligilactobacillus aviarius]
MNFDEINKIIDKFNQSSVRELDINDGEFHLHLSKNENSPETPVQPIQPVQSSEPAVKVENSSKNSAAGSNQIVAPMVGTVYLQPEPGAKPYVEPGKMVHAGDVVCVIEAMKMLTEVKSNVTGQVKNILVENEDLVEYDQPLFEIEEK